MVASEAIARILADGSLNLEARAQALIEAARAAGGPDNITVLILQM